MSVFRQIMMRKKQQYVNAYCIGNLNKENFVVSNFSKTNYMLVPVEITSSDSFEIQIKFKRLSDSPSNVDVLITFLDTQQRYYQLGISSSAGQKWWLWFYGMDKGAINYDFTGYNDWIWCRIKYTKATNNIKISMSYTGVFGGEETVMFDYSVPDTVDFYGLQLGCSSVNKEYIYAEIDMKECWMKKNNSFVWKGVDNHEPYLNKVNYIESTGTQYIDTELNANVGYKIKAKFYTNNVVAKDQTIIGGNESSNIYIGCNFNNNYHSFYRRYGGTWYDNPLNVCYYESLYEIESIIKNGEQRLIINGTERFSESITLTGTTSVHLHIFNRENSNYAYIKLYYLQILDENNILVRDYIPAYIPMISKFCLLDQKTQCIYLNVGTGDFSGGND